LTARAIPARPFLYPIVDVTTVGDAAVVGIVETLAAAGVTLLQLRAKGLPDRAFVDLARAAVTAARREGARLIINDRVDVARVVGSDGVHVGQDDLPPADARRVLGDKAIIGYSTHSLEQLERAVGEPIDYVAIGPVFETRSKENPDPTIGPALVALARARTSIPLVAIGGIDRENAGEVLSAGADGVAVISDLFRAPDLKSALAKLLAALRT
jgi:thiamine-phosphate pyrophosphorylase